MTWTVPLAVFAVAAPGAWAWYFTGSRRAATTAARQWRLIRGAALVAAGSGAVILVGGVVGFVVSGYDWWVLILLWAFGLLHLGLLGPMLRRVTARR